MNSPKKADWRGKELVYKSKRKNKSPDVSANGSTTIVSNSLKKRKVTFNGIEFIDVENYKELNRDEKSNIPDKARKVRNVNCVCILY